MKIKKIVWWGEEIAISGSNENVVFRAAETLSEHDPEELESDNDDEEIE